MVGNKSKRKKYQRSEISIGNGATSGDIFHTQPDLPVTWSEKLAFFVLGVILGLILLTVFLVYAFEKKYRNRVYPGVKIENSDFGGKTKEDIQKYFAAKNADIKNINYIFTWENRLATVSANELNLTYNTDTVIKQAYSEGRRGNIIKNIFTIIDNAAHGTSIPASLLIKTEVFDNHVNGLAKEIDYPAQDALFNFSAGRVVAFRQEKYGRKLNPDKTRKTFIEKTLGLKEAGFKTRELIIPLTIDVVKPDITTEKANTFGIKELIGSGVSTYFHSIDNRIFNIGLATSRINGILVQPGGVFSFNDAVGDISAFTGYKTAYVIKDGRTILGDGGGVCQVSTTLFRAALNSGLPIIERWPHAYRVGYYEQNSEPGVDATVYSPTNDFKFKNDSGGYILIQGIFEPDIYKLTFNFYGQKDGRFVNMTKPIILSRSAPPPDLYQDDPALPKGKIVQADFSAWGAKVKFDYKVENKGQVIFQKTFYSDYRPWQAVFMRGTKE